jgi:hypothetical protein
MIVLQEDFLANGDSLEDSMVIVPLTACRKDTNDNVMSISTASNI